MILLSSFYFSQQTLLVSTYISQNSPIKKEKEKQTNNLKFFQVNQPQKSCNFRRLIGTNSTKIEFLIHIFYNKKTNGERDFRKLKSNEFGQDNDIHWKTSGLRQTQVSMFIYRSQKCTQRIYQISDQTLNLNYTKEKRKEKRVKLSIHKRSRNQATHAALKIQSLHHHHATIRNVFLSAKESNRLHKQKSTFFLCNPCIT